MSHRTKDHIINKFEQNRWSATQGLPFGQVKLMICEAVQTAGLSCMLSNGNRDMPYISSKTESTIIENDG